MLPEVRRTPRARTRRLVLTAAATTFAGLVLAGCTGGSEGSRPSAAAPSPSPRASSAAELDLSGLPIAREPFCDRLDELDVETALGGPVTGTAHYDNGDRVRITPDLTDISHEYNCTFLGADPASARTWVFARPVLRSEALRLVRDARPENGCRFPSFIGFGTPDLTSVCRVDPPTEQDEPAVRVRLQGLFDSSWLTCELTLPSEGPQGGPDRALGGARRWCVRVATALGARP